MCIRDRCIESIVDSCQREAIPTYFARRGHVGIETGARRAVESHGEWPAISLSGQQGAIEIGRAAGAIRLSSCPAVHDFADGMTPAHVGRPIGQRAGELKPGGVLAAIEGPDGDALIAGRDQLLERLVAQRGDGGALPLVGGGQGEFIEEQGEVCLLYTSRCV